MRSKKEIAALLLWILFFKRVYPIELHTKCFTE